MHPLDRLRKFAEAFILTFYELTFAAAESQTGATWTLSHYESHLIPDGYVAVLSLKLKYRPKDTALDAENAERSADG